MAKRKCSLKELVRKIHVFCSANGQAALYVAAEAHVMSAHRIGEIFERKEGRFIYIETSGISAEGK